MHAFKNQKTSKRHFVPVDEICSMWMRVRSAMEHVKNAKNFANFRSSRSHSFSLSFFVYLFDRTVDTDESQREGEEETERKIKAKRKTHLHIHRLLGTLPSRYVRYMNGPFIWTLLSGSGWRHISRARARVWYVIAHTAGGSRAQSSASIVLINSRNLLSHHRWCCAKS